MYTDVTNVQKTALSSFLTNKNIQVCANILRIEFCTNKTDFISKSKGT